MSTHTWPSPANFRDLGGIAVEGGVVRSRRVFRSDDVTTAPDRFLDEMVEELGITQVLDLRAAEESRTVDLDRLGSRGIDYHNITLGGQVMVGHEQPSTIEEMGEFYVRLVEQHAPQMVSAMSLMAWSPGGVVFHCAAGKDRTGMLAAFLLAALGADDDAIAGDFGRSQQNLPQMLGRWRAMAALGSPGLPGLDVLNTMDVASMPMLMTAPVGGLRVAMRLIREREGEFLAPLRRAGLDQHLIAGLRTRLIDPATGDAATPR